MKCLILLMSLVGLVAAKPTADAYAPVYGYYTNPLAVASNQFHAQDEIGQYNYGYSNQDSAKSEVKTADGVVRGSYSYVDANGIIQTTNYISDALGYRVAATNLPVAPAAEAVVATEAVAAEAPVAVEAKSETPVVAAEANNVVVPYVQYVNLPYATNFPYYVAQPEYQQLVGAAVQPVYTQLVDTTVQVAEQPKEANAEEISAAIEPVAPAAPVAQEIISVPILTQYHSQDELGQYQFGYTDQTASRIESKTADGVISGAYNYVDADGQIQTIKYIADALGFRAEGALPVSVQDTPEVVAAREEHLRIVADTIASQPEEEDVESRTDNPEAIVEPNQYQYQPYLINQPIAVQQPYVIQQEVQPVLQQQAYVAVQPQTYVVSQPVVAQPYLAGQPVAVSQPALANSQFHAQDELGQYEYGYANEHSAKTEFKSADGVVHGTYSYIDANGEVQRVDYISDSLGFRVAATNLPKAIVPQSQLVSVVEQQLPGLQPVVVDDVVETTTAVVEVEGPAQPLPVTTEAIEVPQEYDIGIRNGLEALLAGPVEVIVEAKEAVPEAVQEVVQEAVPATQQVVQVVEEAAVPQYAQYILPGYTANYAQAYQPYAATYGYYYNPSYVAASGVPTHTQYHAQDEIGQYNYGYATADSTKTEVKTADGVVQGTYSYVDANGIVQTTNYVSDALGFRVAATNLPVAVSAPAAVEA